MVIAVAINGGANFSPAAPAVLFTVPDLRSSPGFLHYAVSADGQRFLIVQPETEVLSPIVVVLNWAGQH